LKHACYQNVCASKILFVADPIPLYYFVNMMALNAKADMVTSTTIEPKLLIAVISRI